MQSFKCSKCGLCCRHLDRSSLYDKLNRGDGTCLYLDETTNLCKIYASRPLLCRVVESYELFKENISYNDYIKLNEEACKRLKGE